MTTTETKLNSTIHELIQKQVADGRQIGVQVAAYKDGELIVDTWAGTMGPDDDRPVQADTLFNCFSTTKGVAATALHILADRGVIDYDAPVAKYWPEFAANGKENITVAQAMSHQAGLHTAPSKEITLDWDRAIDYIASGVPAWEPGTATGYHAITYAWVVGGIVQGASGRHIKDVIAEEIAAPLGVGSEMFVGIPDGVEDRLATLKTARATACGRAKPDGCAAAGPRLLQGDAAEQRARLQRHGDTQGVHSIGERPLQRPLAGEDVRRARQRRRDRRRAAGLEGASGTDERDPDRAGRPRDLHAAAEEHRLLQRRQLGDGQARRHRSAAHGVRSPRRGRVDRVRGPGGRV